MTTSDNTVQLSTQPQRFSRMWRRALSNMDPISSAQYIVRPALNTDIPVLTNLCYRTFSATIDQATEDAFHTKLKGIFDGRYGTFMKAASFVYELDSREIAAAILITHYIPYGAPVIAMLAVRPDMQRKGLGVALLARSVATLTQQGESACCACISFGNKPSEQLFRVCGFKPETI